MPSLGNILFTRKDNISLKLNGDARHCACYTKPAGARDDITRDEALKSQYCINSIT